MQSVVLGMTSRLWLLTNHCKLLFAAFCCLIIAPSVQAFSINGSKWPGAETPFYVQLSGISSTGVSWNTAFISAMNEWNASTPFNFVLRDEYRNPCANDLVNSVDFTDTVCGSSFGNNVLAVTIRTWETDLLGPPKIVRSDIVFNNKVVYDVYDGNLVQVGIPPGVIDFRRVALHELGHALGLDHDNTQTSSIMRSSIGNIYQLQTDDINGVSTLYGGLSNCQVSQLSFGIANDSLDTGDCNVQMLTVGGTDDSFVDVRKLELQTTTTVDLIMRSATLDSVLLLADSKLRFITQDDNSGGNCDARLNLTLSPGTYYVLANTYDSPTNCGNNKGSYQLQASFSKNQVSTLGQVVSLNGGTANVQFSGGITADNGLSFGNRFHSTDELDITVTLVIDPLHFGKPGFLVVAALINGVIHLLNDQGEFIPYAGGNAPILHVASGPLKAVEQVEIARDLVPASLGIQNFQGDFLVGYGLDSNPTEVYYHKTPLNLIIDP